MRNKLFKLIPLLEEPSRKLLTLLLGQYSYLASKPACNVYRPLLPGPSASKGGLADVEIFLIFHVRANVGRANINFSLGIPLPILKQFGINGSG